MLATTRIANICSIQRRISTLSHRFSIQIFFYASCSSAVKCVDEDCDFLPWLVRKAGAKISSVLSIGNSAHGRSLCASKYIQTGDCILEVPYTVQLAADDLPPNIDSLLAEKVGNISRLAIVISLEKKRGQDSEWAPYINRLPKLDEMHSTIFWSDDELRMIKQSSLYQETIKEKAHIEKEFLEIKKVVHYFPDFFGDTTLMDFKHAYGLVSSRAWGSTRGVSMVPFADFLNHDGVSEADLLCNFDKQLFEVIADRNYSPGDQVFVRYGKFSDATLLLGYGFTVPHNIYDQVQIELSIPHHDCLHEMKLQLVQKHFTPTVKNVNDFCSSWNSFTIKEVKSPNGKGKGIPQSLLAFARVLCSDSPQELSDLAMEATQTDGRLARRPLRNRCKEIQAHQFLLSKITELICDYKTFIEVHLLENPSSSHMSHKLAIRRRMSQDLLNGELCVLKSASSWLENRCSSLPKS